MKKKAKERNPHCPVPGCKTPIPHNQDPVTKGLIDEFSSPEKMTDWVLTGMVELGNSIARDLGENMYFAWHTRLRQPEELYIRTLYCLFIASKEELPHVISGDQPNSFAAIYREVNKVVLGGRGLLLTPQPGLGTSTPLDTLNDGAHASFRAFVTCIGMARYPEFLPPSVTEKYCEYIDKYCRYLKHMYGLFKAGRTK